MEEIIIPAIMAASSFVVGFGLGNLVKDGWTDYVLHSARKERRKAEGILHEARLQAAENENLRKIWGPVLENPIHKAYGAAIGDRFATLIAERDAARK